MGRIGLAILITCCSHRIPPQSLRNGPLASDIGARSEYKGAESDLHAHWRRSGGRYVLDLRRLGRRLSAGLPGNWRLGFLHWNRYGRGLQFGFQSGSDPRTISDAPGGAMRKTS